MVERVKINKPAEKKPAKKPPEPTYGTKQVRDLSEAVYRTRLGPEDVASMIKKDADNGEKLRGRAASYDSLSRLYLETLKIKPE